MISEGTLSEIKSSAKKEILTCQNEIELESLRLRLLGKKGTVTSLLKSLSSLPPEERPKFGALVNETKIEIDYLISKQQESLKQLTFLKQIENEWIDVTLPTNPPSPLTSIGSIHPLTRVEQELERVFTSLGFNVVDGPEVEAEFYNFEALNVPDSHPARDMQDTIWTTCGNLLRTQTSAIQVRALEQIKPPLRIVAPGRCFRYERVDATHEHTFYQMEGMMIDKNVTVGHLIYFMKTLLRELFGFDPKIRLRPGYFPFVEPGFELDIWFNNCWLELLPCGLVHPTVLKHGGINPDEWQGFAFGLGLSRLVMSRFMIDDIRHLQGGDLRFLKQFT